MASLSLAREPIAAVRRAGVAATRPAAIALGAITLMGLLVRLYNLGGPSLTADEALSAVFYSRPLGELFRTLVADDLHPPLYPLLLGGWMALFGQSETVLRLPSVLVGVLLVPATAAAARTFWRRDPDATLIGLLAAALTAVSPVEVYYSQVARNYMLVTLLGLLSGVALFRGLRDGGWRGWLPYTLAVAAALYTHYNAFLVLPAQVLVVLLLARPYRRRLVGFALALFGGLLLFAPWALYMVKQLLRISDYLAIPQSVSDMGRAALTELVAGAAGGELGRFLVPLIALALGLVVLGLGSVMRAVGAEERAATLYLFLAAALPVGILLAVWSVFPKYGPRYLLIVAPVLTLLVARGLVLLLGLSPAGGPLRVLAVGGRVLGVVLGLVAFGGSALALRSSFAAEPAQDYRGIADAIRADLRPRDVVAFMPYAWQPITYYFRNGPAVRMETSQFEDDFAYAARMARWFSVAYDRVWLVWYFPEWSDPAGMTRHFLDERSVLPPVTRDFGTVHLTLYTFDQTRRDVPDPIVDNPAELRFENGVAFKGWSVVRPPPRPGAPSQLDMHWRAERPLAADFKVVVTVEDAAEHVVARLDRTPVLPLYAPKRWRAGDLLHGPIPFTLPPGTPPGRYRLRMWLYDEASGREIGALGPDGRVVGTRVTIGELTVDHPLAPPTPESVAVEQRFDPPATLGALRLIGVDLPSGELSEGDAVDIALLWQAPAALSDDRTVVLQGIGMDGRTLLEATLPPVTGFPTGQWRAGDVWLGRHRVKLPLDVPGGKLRLRVGASPAGPFAPLGELNVKHRPVSRDIPTMQHALGSELGGMVRLLGYDLDAGEVRAGGRVRLTLYWQATGPIDRNYKVFNHVVGADARPVGQQDSEPLDGAVKMVAWRPGEVLKDTHVVPVQPGTLPGEYQLIVGLYDPESGRRLPVAGGGDSVSVATLRVR